MRTPIPNPRHYELSGPLGGNGDSYRLELCGPGIRAASFRQLITILTMTAEWLEADEAEGRRDPIAVRLEEIAADENPAIPPAQERIK
jgi:hypothetical protein